MKNKFLLIFCCFIFTAFHLYGQGSTCGASTAICNSSFSLFPSNGTNLPAGNNYGCAFTSSSARTSWFYVQVATAGSVNISLTPSTLDIDFALWGPYASVAAAQSACGSLPAPIDCDGTASGTSAVVANIPSGVVGQFYVLMVINYWATTQTMSVTTSGTGTMAPCVCLSPPSINITQTTVNVCAGAVASFNYTSSNGAANVTKTGTGTLSATSLPNGTSTFTYTPSVADAGTIVTITATIPDPDGAGPCTSSSDIVTVTVSPVLSVTPTATPNAICAGTSSSLSAASTGGTAPVNYAWNNGAGLGTPVSVAPASTTTYTVTATDANSCTATNTISLTVNPLPTVSISGTTSICSGANTNITFSGTANAIVTYTINGGTNQIVGLNVAGSATVNTGNLAANATYTLVSVTNGTCSQNVSGNAVVTVNALPNATISGTATVCSGGNSNIVFNGTANAIVTYTLNGTTQTVTLNGAGTATVNTGAISSTATYSLVSVTNGTCSRTLSGSAVVSINPLPTASISGSTSICSGSNANIFFTGTANATVSYVLNGTPQTVTLNASGTATVNTGAIVATAIYTLVSVTNGSCSQNLTGTVAITVNALPNATISGTTSICAGSNTTITFNGTSGAIVTYNVNGGANQTVTLTGGTATVNTGALNASAIYDLVSVVSGSCSRNLTGSATVTVNPLPTATINGSTTICSGSSANISFSGTANAIVTYNDGTSNQTVTLTNGLATVNTGALNANVTYTLVSVNDGTCLQTLTGSATITVNPTPTTSYTLTGGGAYCAGGTGAVVGLSGSDLGVNYQLQVNGSNILGALVAGTGAAISFGNQTTVGSYTVVATNGITNCTSSLTGGAVTISTNFLPTATINGSTTICSGSSANISFSGTSGAIVTYNDGTSNQTVTLTNGLATVSTGVLNANVTYTLVSVNDGTCSQNVVGSATITVNPTPITSYTLTGGGAYCAGGTGAVVGLSGSDLGVDYQLQVNGSNILGALVAGTGAAISFGNQTTVGSYTVVATNATTSCTSSLTGGAVSISTNPLPTATINGSTTICSGASANISFSGTPNAIVTYNDGSSNQTVTLINGLATVNTGALNANVTYTLVSVNDGTCSQNLVGSATITVNPTPTTSYTLTGGGAYCAGGTGAVVGLSGSDLGVDYQLQVNGSNILGALVTGTGAAISFGNQTTAGSYTVVAINTTTSCSSTLSTGAVSVVVNALPTSTVNGSTMICAGTSTSISFSGTIGAVVTYNINGGANQTATLTNGIAIVSTGVLNANVTYNLVSITNGTCSQNLIGSATVTVNPTPTSTFTLTGGGAYCAGGTGAVVGLSGSDLGVNYQLQANGSNVGAVVAGTGAVISFGNQTTVGTYTVVATNIVTGCNAYLASGAVAVSTNNLPTANINGSTTICSGANTTISFSGTSGAVVTYTVNGGANQTITLTNGLATINTGALTSATTYNLVSVSDGTCSQNLVGSAVVGINPLPIASIAIRGGGIYCAGGLGVVISLDTSEIGINYQLVLNGTNTGAPVAGTGGLLSFGYQTGVGTYTIIATNPITGCSVALNGSAVIAMNPLPVAAISGTTAICAGDSANIILTGTPNATLIYSITTGGVSQNDTLIFPANGSVVLNTGALNANIDYTLVDVSDGICNQPLTDNALVTVNPTPNTTFTLTGGGAYCAGGTGVILGLSGSELNVDYQLQINGQNVGIPFTGTGNSLTFGAQTAAGIYTIAATNTMTACASSNVGGSTTVSINPLPTASITGSTTVCAGDNADIIFSGTPNAVVSYSINGGGMQTIIIGANGLAVMNIGPFIVPGICSLGSIYDGFCSQNLTGIVTIGVNPMPTASISGNTSICSGANATISFTGTPNATVNYQVNGVAASLTLSAAGTATVNATALTSTNVYSLVDVTLGSCAQAVSGTATVTVNPTPTASISGAATICAGDNTNITFSGTIGAIITYNVNGGATQTATLTNGSFIINVNPSVTTVYDLVSVALGSCTQNINTSATVTVNTLPTASISGTTSICSGGNATISFTGTPNATVNYQVNGVAASLTLNGAGTATVNATALSSTNVYSLVDVTLGSCSQAVSGTATVTVNPTPIASISGTTTICAGDNTNITFSGTIGAIITYNTGGANTTAILTNGSFILPVNPSVTTVYNLVSVNLNGCVQNINASATVTVNTLPTASISGTTSICSGGNATVSFTGTPNATVNYQVNGVAASLTLNAAGTAMVNATALTTTNVYSLVDVTLGSCTQAVNGTAVVTVNALPIVTISGNAAICTGSNTNITFSGTSGATVIYNVNNGANQTIVLTNGLAILNTGVLSANTTYNLISVSLAGCSQAATGSATVNVNSSITVDAGTPQTLCQGGSVILNGTMGGGATTAIWSAPSGAFTNATSLNAVYSPSITSGIVTLTLTASDASGNCSSTANVDITVNAGQDASFAYPAASYCQSSTLNPLTNIATGNYTYTALSPVGVLTINANTGEIDLQNSLAGTYQIFNIVPSNGICPADTAYQFIIIEKTPDASFQYDKNIYCGSQYAPILLQNAGQQGAFSYIGSNNLTLNVSTGAIDLTTSAYGTYLIIKTVNGSGVCPASTDTFELKYVEKPNAQITPSGTFDYCLVGNVNMQVSGGATYQWLKNGQTIIGATNDTYTATQAGYYAAIAYNNEGCADTSDVVIINVGNAPDASVKTNGSTTFCEGSSVNLISAWLGNATYQWLRNGVLLNTNATQIAVTDAANYQLIVSNACGADTSSIISTQIATTPIPNFSWSPEVIFKGQPVVFNDSSTNAATWSWYFGDGQIEYEENPTNVFYEAGEYTVYMQVRNSFGCDSSITKTLIVRNPGAYFIPNVFTPNGDGAFDTWQVEADGYEKLEIEVFDRWGVQLFESSDAKKQWDGNTKGGRTCQNGVYFYHVKIYFFNGDVKEEKGNVTLIR